MKYLLIVLLTTGCSSKLVTSTPRTVVIENASAYNTKETQHLADFECAKHGRYAIHIPDSQRDGIVTYGCVE